MAVLDLDEAGFDQLISVEQKPALIEFWATWCGPCRIVGPIIDSLAEEFGSRVPVFRVDVDAQPELAARFNIRSIPTCLFFLDGRIVDSLVGAVPRQPFVRKITELYPEVPDDPPVAVSAEVAMAVASVDGKLKVVALLADGTYHYLDEGEKKHRILYTLSLQDQVLIRAVEELEDLMNSRAVKEQDFHAFFERHPDFILNDEYKSAHSKVVLERDDRETLIPDFVLEPYNQQGFCDLLELKTPDARTYVLKKNRSRFSSAVFEAVAQLREYSRYFDEEHHRDRIEQKYGLRAYKPRMFVILGRRGSIDPLAARAAEQDAPGLVLRTFDDILERMQGRLNRYRI